MFQSAKALYGNNGFANAVQTFFLILKQAYQYKQDEIGTHKLDCSLLVAIKIWIVDFCE
jgi:hypothetical protein